MKVTWSAKTRIKTDIIEFFFQEDSSMDLASRMIWRFGRPMKLDTSSFSVKSPSAVLHFCHLTSFAEETKENTFSAKSSWKVRWIIMFQKDAVCWRDNGEKANIWSWPDRTTSFFLSCVIILLMEVSEEKSEARDNSSTSLDI